MGKAHSVVTVEDLKALSGIPSHEVMNHHIHKLVQVDFFSFDCVTHELGWFLMLITLLIIFQVLGEIIHITFEYLSHEEKAVVAESKVEALEAKIGKLKRDLIIVMDEVNSAKKKAKALADELKVKQQLTVQKDEQF